MRLIEHTPERWNRYCEKHYPMGEGIFALRRQRNWKRMSDAELAAYAERFIESGKIGGRFDLLKADKGLYGALLRRNLLDEVGLLEKSQYWVGMNREELAGLAESFIAIRGISGRTELRNADKGLYGALQKRKLLDVLFPEADIQKLSEAVDGVIGALESFGDEG